MFKKHKNQDLEISFPWKKNPKSPNEYIRYCLEQLSKISGATTNDNKKKCQDELFKYLVAIKEMSLSEGDSENVHELYLEMNNNNFFYELIANFHELNLELMKEVFLLLSVAISYTKDNKFVTVDYFVLNPITITYMLRKMEMVLSSPSSGSRKTVSVDTFQILGNMVLECVKYEQLCRIILIKDNQFWKFFSFSRLSNFEIGTMSFQILHSLLTTHEKLVSKEFFAQEANMIKFLQNINKLMAHGNYVTKRQSSRLLYELMIIRSNNHLMLTYISHPENLKLIMTLMTEKSKNLQIEAFNLFKVFVANPRKTKAISDILIKNRDKLLKYLETFASDVKDPMLKDEKSFIYEEIESLPRLFLSTSETASSSPATPPSSQTLATL